MTRIVFNKKIDLDEQGQPEETQVGMLFFLLHDAVKLLPQTGPSVENDITRIAAECQIIELVQELSLALTGMTTDLKAPDQPQQSFDISQAPEPAKEEEFWEIIGIADARNITIGYRVRFKHPDGLGRYLHGNEYMTGPNGKNPTIEHCLKSARQEAARKNGLREVPWGYEESKSEP